MTNDAAAPSAPGHRARVLIAAYACGPSDTPEASAGWAFATAAAQHHEVWVITRSIWVPAIQRALHADPILARTLHVVGIDLSDALIKRKRRALDLYWYYALWQRKLGRVARELHRAIRFDVAHHVTFANDWLPSGVAALRDVPLVWGPVGGATRIPVWRLRRWLGVRGVAHEVVRTAATTLPRKLWGETNARRAAIVVVQNDDVAHRFRRARKVIVEPNAALDMSALPARVVPQRSTAARHAVFVGRLIPLKGVSIALAALARPGGAAWHLTIYGDGPLRAPLEAEAAALGIAARVRFAGHVPRSEALDAMARADALLFPSMHDQAGWAVAEASSIGTPVVCLPLGGPPILAAPNDLIASLDGDIVDNVVQQLTLAGSSEGVPHQRWSGTRLVATVDAWYGDAMESRPQAASHPDEPPLRVLESVSAIRPTTNPYLAQLVSSLRRQRGVVVDLFSYRRALFGSYDVLHVHWPEVLFGGNRRVGRLGRRTLATLLLARLRLTRTPIVRTWHNLDRPDGMSGWDRALLDGFDRRTHAVIRLNETTPVPLAVPVHTIAHGHYRDWFGDAADAAAPASVAYVGLVRRYKGVEQLIRAFRDCRSPGATLKVAGKPTSAELAGSLIDLATGDERVSLELEFLDDAAFARTVRRASLVVLPYRHMHNSGTVLASLSLGRPVLVPANDLNRALAAEVGPGWLHMFEGELSGAAIDAALTAVASIPPANPPRLGQRDWAPAAAAHVDVLSAAVRGKPTLTRARRGVQQPTPLHLPAPAPVAPPLVGSAT